MPDAASFVPARWWCPRAERARTAAGQPSSDFPKILHWRLNPASSTDGLHQPTRSSPNRLPNPTPSVLPPWWVPLALQRPARRPLPRNRPYPPPPSQRPTTPPDVALQQNADQPAMRHHEPGSLPILTPLPNRLQMRAHAAPSPIHATIRQARPVQPASMQSGPRSASVSVSSPASALAVAPGAASSWRTYAAPAPPARADYAVLLRRPASSPRRHAPLRPWPRLHQPHRLPQPHCGRSPAAARRSGAHNVHCFWAPSCWSTSTCATANRHRRCDGGALPHRAWRGRVTAQGRMHRRPTRRRRASGSRSARAG